MLFSSYTDDDRQKIYNDVLLAVSKTIVGKLYNIYEIFFRLDCDLQIKSDNEEDIKRAFSKICQDYSYFQNISRNVSYGELFDLIHTNYKPIQYDDGGIYISPEVEDQIRKCVQKMIIKSKEQSFVDTLKYQDKNPYSTKNLL